MPVRLCLLLLLIVPSTGCAAAAPPTPPTTRGDTPESLFDPSRHLPLSEVRAGMRGYGLTVMSGVDPVRFDVEVISVLRNLTGPRQDAVLARLSGIGLETTGAIAGMSGSPIYLRDDKGNDRLVGALAFSWPLAKEPLVGIQPIEAMLRIRTRPTTRPNAAAAGRIDRFDLARLGALPGLGLRTGSTEVAGSNPSSPTPLRLPLMVSGFPDAARAHLERTLGTAVLSPLQSGVAATTRPVDARIEPGAALAVPLMIGDFEATAIGTVTEVIDGRVFAFGHPLNAEGSIELPMATGYVHGVIPLLSSSFKIGSMVQMVGSIYGDEQSGIAGRLGQVPALVPVELTVTLPDGQVDRYRFQVARHHALTAVLLNAAVTAAITARSELPLEHTLHFDVELRFAGNRKVSFSNTDASSTGPSGVLSLVAPVVAIASDNPFERVPLESATLRLRVESGARSGRITHAALDRRKYRPGDTARLRVTFSEHGGSDRSIELAFPLPGDLRPGDYSLTIRDWERHLADEMARRSFRFQSRNIDELFAVLDDFLAVRRAALYLRLSGSSRGIAVGRLPLGSLPSSRAQLLQSSGRSDVSQFDDGPLLVRATELVLSGSADLPIVIEAPVSGTK